MFRLLFLFFLAMTAAQAAGPPALTIHYFRADGCPHCEDAGAFFARLAAEEPRIAVRDYEVSRDPENRALFQAALDALGVAEGGVPFIFVGDWATLGYHTDATTGAEIRRQVARCLATGCPDALAAIREGRAPALQPPREAGAGLLRLPFIGEVAAAALSLPLLTLTVAALDAFNPCAFFVLLFLLSMMAHQKSRARMLAVGGIFVLFSGLMYFAFMAAWLSLFQLLGQLAWVTLAAGLLAVVVGAVNVKDFFLFGRGVSLSIPESKKPDIFRRARAVLAADKLPAMLAATVFLAVAANFYELLCTAGFPMVYTRILTLGEPSVAMRYFYLALYNLVYVLPLAAIVLVFVRTLGARKLGEREGRLLKLLSGTMMLELGVLLLAAPEWLSRLGVAFALLAGAVAVTWLAARLTR
ncbi:MAG: membrane protein [Betaproteobacteria bacterium]|nr:MAG: membrane protein [Betaproteobacteria bacterium]